MIVDGTYALHASLRSLLDIRVAVVTYTLKLYLNLDKELKAIIFCPASNVMISKCGWWIRLVEFTSVFFLKFDTTLGILVHWITLLTASFQCLGNTLNQTFTMLRSGFFSLTSTIFEIAFLSCGFILQIRINNSFVSSFREAIYKLKCRSEVYSSFHSSLQC